MKVKKIIGITLVVLFSLFVIASFSQRGSAQTDSSSPTSSQGTTGTMGRNGMMDGGMMTGGMTYGRMMNGRMMYGRMGRYMMENYNAMRNLIDRVSSDLSRARAEASSAAIKSKLADADAAIAQLKKEYSRTWGMMGYMPMNDYHCYWNQPQQDQN